MNWKQHIIVGLIFGLLLSFFIRVDVLQAIILIVFSGLCALIPDLDHQMSKGREILDKGVPLVALIFSIYSTCIGGIECVANVEKITNIVKSTLLISGFYFVVITYLKPKHRGITHTLLICAAFGVLTYLTVGEKFAFFGSVGYLSHLVADREIKII